MRRAQRDQHTLSLFGTSLLPDVGKPFSGHVTDPAGEWAVYCPGVRGFNSLMPASWGGDYSNNDEAAA